MIDLKYINHKKLINFIGPIEYTDWYFSKNNKYKNKKRDIMDLTKELTAYVFFGVLTTIVNFVTYFLFEGLFGINYLISNIIAWFVSVLFAYITNRIWVFESKDDNIIKEVLLFYGGRVFSGAIDTALMYVFISILMTGDLFAKIVVQVVVTILNYVFSKFLVFK